MLSKFRTVYIPSWKVCVALCYPVVRYITMAWETGHNNSIQQWNTFLGWIEIYTDKYKRNKVYVQLFEF